MNICSKQNNINIKRVHIVWNVDKWPLLVAGEVYPKIALKTSYV